MRRGRHLPAEVLYREMEEDAATDLALAELELCERVRSCGVVSADSMWEATFGGDLTDDTPAWRLHNPVRARREQEAAEQRQRKAWARQRAEREQARIELERQRAEAAAGWAAQEQAAASFHAEAERRRQQHNPTQAEHDAAWAAFDADPERQERLRQIALKAAQQGQGVVSVSGPGWTSWLWQQHAEAQWRAEMERLERAAQGAEVMKKWEAIVARHGWSQEEAMTYWHDWLTGPPGLFG
jgi:hypothetical protein